MYHLFVAEKLTTQQVSSWLRALAIPAYRKATRRQPTVEGLAVRLGNGSIIVLDNGAGAQALVKLSTHALAQGYRVANNKRQPLTSPTTADMFGCVLIEQRWTGC